MVFLQKKEEKEKMSVYITFEEKKGRGRSDEEKLMTEKKNMMTGKKKNENE